MISTARHDGGLKKVACTHVTWLKKRLWITNLIDKVESMNEENIRESYSVLRTHGPLYAAIKSKIMRNPFRSHMCNG